MSYVYYKMFFNTITFSDATNVNPINLGKIMGLLMINPLGSNASFFLFFVKRTSIEYINGTDVEYPFTLKMENGEVIYTPLSVYAGYVKMWTMKPV